MAANPPNYQYYDLMVSNLNNSTTLLPPPLTFIETRTIPYLHNPKDYSMSITRFSLSTANLPVVLPTIKSGSTDINETTYTVTLYYSCIGNTLGLAPMQSKQIQISFIPQNTTASLPTSPSLTSDRLQDNSTGYYNIYSYQYFVNLINSQIAQGYAEFYAELAGLGLPVPATAENQPPILSFDTSSKLATFFIPATLNDDGDNLWGTWYSTQETQPTNYQFQVWFNTSLYSLFVSLPCLNGYYKYGGVTNSLASNQLIIPINSQNFPQISMPIGSPVLNQYLTFPICQEYSTVNSWSPVSSIVFTSATLPIISNQLSNPIGLPALFKSR